MRLRDSVRKVATAAFALAWVCLGPSPLPSLQATSGQARAADDEATASASAANFKFELIVANLTNSYSKIDKGARRLDKELKSQFRYEGIRVLETVDVKLSGDEIWDLKLPSRRRLRIRPLVIEQGSALISVEISGLVQSDLRVRRGQLVIIGAERFGDGKLVIAIDASR